MGLTFNELNKTNVYKVLNISGGVINTDITYPGFLFLVDIYITIFSIKCQGINYKSRNLNTTELLTYTVKVLEQDSVSLYLWLFRFFFTLIVKNDQN